MARHLHLDPLGGIAGDMFIAALLDAFPEHGEGVVAAMRAAGLPESWAVSIAAHDDRGLTGRRLQIVPPPSPSRPTGRFRDIRDRLCAAPLPAGTAERAVALFAVLAAAEGAIHGVAAEDVHFHEIADWDSVADIVGAAFLIEALSPATWSVGPLPLGGGRVNTAHGPLPVPGPATAKLLEGFALTDDGIGGERVTPTGAAILRHLEAAPRPAAGALILERSGMGFGTRRLPGLSNVLRVLSFAAAAPVWQAEQIGVIGFEIDDQTPEDLAHGLDAIRAAPGVLDVVQIAAAGKKGRLAVHVQVLCRRESLDGAIDACFRETTTIGLRWQLAARARLPRTEARAAGVRIKRTVRPGGRASIKAEHDDIAGAGGYRARLKRRRRAEAPGKGGGDA